MRYLGLAVDANSATGGTTFDDLDPATIPVPTRIVPVSTAQVNPGLRNLSRSNLVTGFRGQLPEESFASAPELTFETLAFTTLMRQLLPRAMGGAPVDAGGPPPAAIESTVQTALSGANLPSLVGTLIREGEVDRVTGLWANEVEFNFPVDEEGTVNATLWGLFQDVDATGAVPGLPAPSGLDNYEVAYMLRDVKAILGDGAGVPIDCLAGFGFTINNNLIDDFRSRFCADKNIEELDIDGQLHRLWYPDKNKLGPQTITGRLDFGDVKPDLELRRLFMHAEKLVVELYADPLATTPVVDESIRLTFHKQAYTGGGPDPLQREGDQVSSYEFTAYIDPATGKDLEATFVGETAIDYAVL